LTEEIVSNRSVASGINKAKEMVISGKKLSEGFKNNRQVFPSIMIRITEAGERSGSLEKSLLEVANFLDYQVANKLKTVTALMEPVMLVVIGGLIGGMMLAIIGPIYQLIGQVGNK